MGLYRSRTDNKLFGLCGGIARSTGVDPTLVRVAFVIGGLATGGTLFFIYILAAMVVPKEPEAIFSGYGNYGYSSYGYAGASYRPVPQAQPVSPTKDSTIDDMMQHLEQKAMQREIEALKHKLSQYETRQTEGER